MSLFLKTLGRAAYSAEQSVRIAWHTAHYAAIRHISGPAGRPGEAPYAARSPRLSRDALARAFRAVFAQEWRYIKAGYYAAPRSRWRPGAGLRALKTSRALLRDARRVARRKQAGGHSEANRPESAHLPRYYRQNFHFQTDGWLSDASAAIYDAQVEALFTGAAGPMRRQALVPLARFLADMDTRRMRFVDIGTGTGAFLREVVERYPRMPSIGIDLSTPYLRRARRRCPAGRFIQANAEQIPLADASVDIVSACYLFHELPAAARARVAAEIGRVLRPGGLFLLTDTIQRGDAPELDILLELFPREFHEPYFASYIEADLKALFAPSRLALFDERTGFLTKSSAFRKL
ncbi:MAG: class I SAM-dependent methyltransferase [Parvularculaceae bacterium]